MNRKGKMKWRIGFLIGIACLFLLGGCRGQEEENEIVLRIANWEEYIDEGGWDKEEAIELEDGTTVFGENSMLDDFEKWYEEKYGKKVRIEYSAFGTNEDMYNQMTLGDRFDLICPSEYMIMKLMKEKKLESFSDEFLDEKKEGNYYSEGVSPYIRDVFSNLTIDGNSLERYAAGYMWGVMGIVYNPKEVLEEDVKHWSVLLDERYKRRITMKDSVRDSYLVALGILHEKQLESKTFMQSANYKERLSSLLNDTSQTTVDKVEEILDAMRNNAYSLETDSGKADMVTGKVVANMQWSGDGAYTLDQAEEDGLELSYAVPDGCSNIWFDGFCLLKDGIAGDTEKKKAAEAFVNFLARPDNVVRNMYYVGYTSAIAGGDSDMILQYADWCFGAKQGEEDTTEYSLAYFFTKSEEEREQKKYVLSVPKNQIKRQISAQYPAEDVLRRSAVMKYFGAEANQRISKMWINIRCFDGFDL